MTPADRLRLLASTIASMTALIDAPATPQNTRAATVKARDELQRELNELLVEMAGERA